MTRPRSPQMFAHAADVLNLDAVLGLVAGYCVSDRARDIIRSLVPLTDADEISDSLRAIEELRAWRAAEGDVVVADTGYAAEVEQTRTRPDSLATEALLAIAAGERAAADLHGAITPRADDYPLLAERVAGIVADTALVRAIDRAIDGDGNVRDNASPELRRIRRQIQSLRANLRSLSEKMVGSFGEDSLTTVLGSRHVLVVSRSRVPRRDGLVHSASHSGGSLYFEPPALVEMNNELEAMFAAEGAEVARILAELTASVRAAADRLLANAAAVTEMDVLRARARFCAEYRCTSPELSAPGRVLLHQARHPLLEQALARSDSPGSLVPLDVEIVPGARVLVISGPNAGGKTVALKTLGICALLLQCGLQAPCGEGSALPVFDRVFVDIGDEQSMETSLSTFTSHLHHLDEMTRHADARTLCLVDEIGDGTDPDEGAALAIATLERLLASQAVVVATTHFGRIKTFALETDGVANGSMAFDDDGAVPLYRLLQGVAGRSRGLETARRSGFDPDVVRRAEEVTGDSAFRLESILAALEAEKLALEEAREAAEARQAELERQIEDYRRKSEEYNMTRGEARRRALAEAEELLTEARREVEDVVRSIRERDAERDAIREGRERLEKRLDRARGEMARESRPAGQPLSSVEPGARVSLNPAGEPSGEVISVRGDRAQVEINHKRITLPVSKLYPASTTGAPAREAVSWDVQVEPLTSTTVDVRGRDRGDALSAVARFLDQAILAGVREVTVIHGIGEGILARAVRDALQQDARVESTRMGEQVEGGAGVTVVRLK